MEKARLMEDGYLAGNDHGLLDSMLLTWLLVNQMRLTVDETDQLIDVLKTIGWLPE